MILVIFFFTFLQPSTQLCESKIFCKGKLLDTIQKARIFPDSKTFVDLKMIHNEQTTLQFFETFLKNTHQNPNHRQIRQFVLTNFVKREELEPWTPPDFPKDPKLLHRICDTEIRNFTQELINIWPKLARKVKKEVLENVESYSILPAKYGFIIAGGRFREFYYWDSYWIVEGLLLCEMYETVEGMLNNFVSLVKTYGFVPNGSRIYYLNRSQPPLLTLMVNKYVQATNNTNWLKQNIDILEKELLFFLNNRTTEVVKNGIRYQLAHYNSDDGTPRPESYNEDVTTASSLYKNEEKRQLYEDLQSAAESGWDFSSRWIIDKDGRNNANLTSTHTRRIIPVDLNSFLCQAFTKMSEFFKILQNNNRATFWKEKAHLWKKTIEKVLYDRNDGIWYDYDSFLNKPRKFFYPSNFAPLWANAYDLSKSSEFGKRAADYLVTQKVLDYDGGIPTSLIRTGQQWDFPNAWPPLQAMVIFGLDGTGSERAVKIAKILAKKWLKSNMRSFYKRRKMFEKYDVQSSGKTGGGGEYEVQSGFGWTNGVLFQIIDRYYARPKKNNK